MSENVFPIFDKFIQKKEKESFLKQKGITVWLTGLSGSGKTSIAFALEKLFFDQGFLIQVLDGDNIRSGINNNLSFKKEDRIENIRRVAEINKLFNNCGVITISCFISPLNEMRDLAKKIIGPDNFFEIFINTPLDVCEQRDVKGLYKKARSGMIPNFTGVSAPFEEPKNPFLQLNTVDRTADECASEVFKALDDKIT